MADRSRHVPKPSIIFARVEEITGCKIPPEFRKPALSKQFWRMASTDYATGLPNYVGFVQEVEHVQLRRGDKPCTVIFCDLNHFKSYNNRLGSQTTDRIIEVIAQCLQDSIRSDPKSKSRGTDVLARGKKGEGEFLARSNKAGDEFLILMEGATRKQAEGRMEEVCHGLARKIFVIPSQRAALTNVTFAYGCHQLDEDTPVLAIDKAEGVMQKKKKKMKEGDAAEPSITPLGQRDFQRLVKSRLTDPDIVLVPGQEEPKASRHVN